MSIYFNIDLSNFKIINELGEGTFGKVFLIQDNKTQKKFAAKISKIEYSLALEQQALCQKFSMYSNFNNHAILPLHGFNLLNFDNQNFPTIITEYMPQGSLGQLIKRKTRLPSFKKYIILIGIAEGLKYLHSRTITHLNLKPNNVLLDKNYYPYICDFGKQQKSDLSDPSIISDRGTPLYMAPEVFMNDHATAKSDVFSFSILAYELITESFPYPGAKNFVQLQKEIKEGRRPNLSHIPNPEIQKLLSKCWTLDPKNRPNFKEIIDQMKEKSFIKAMDADKEEVEAYFHYFTEKLPPLKSNSKSSSEKVEHADNLQKKEASKDRAKLLEIKKSAEGGNPDSMFAYAQMLESGNGVEANKTESIKYYKMAADKGNTEAMNKYASLLENGDDVEQNSEESTRYYKMSADKGNTEGLNKYAEALKCGFGVKRNDEESTRIYKISADKGDAEGMYRYGLALRNGSGITPDKKEAARYLKMAADKGHADAIYKYVRALLKCEGIEKNMKETARYCKMGVDKGDTDCMRIYATMLLRGDGIEANQKEAERYFKMANDSGDKTAMIFYGDILYKGDGVEVNKEEAARCYKIAADAGYKSAMKSYADMLFNGDGIKSNEKEAARYYKKLADKGDSEGLLIYGRMLYNGDIIEIDEEEAARCFKKLADEKDTDGCNMYGYMLRYGDGIEVNKEEAARCYKISAESGDTTAMANYASMVYNGEINGADKSEAMNYFRAIFELK